MEKKPIKKNICVTNVENRYKSKKKIKKKKKKKKKKIRYHVLVCLFVMFLYYLSVFVINK